MRSIRVREQNQFGELLDYVHDRRFKLDDIQFDQTYGTLRLPIEVRVRRNRKILGISVKGSAASFAELLVRNVTGWRVQEDKAEIGYGDVNRVLRTERGLVIEGSLTVSIEIDTKDIDLE